jgi:methyl-accepting chemotaxis protein
MARSVSPVAGDAERDVSGEAHGMKDCAISKPPAGGPFRSIQRWFHTLKVSQKLMLISIFFVMPDSLMLYLFITGINGHIEFATMEKKGNAYQRPLEDLLELLPQHGLLAERAADGGPLLREQLARKQAQIEAAFDQLETIDARIGTDLQFTDEGLAKRKREHYRAQTVRGEWEELKTQLAQLDRTTASERHQHLIADVRMMITHAGDLSNLILDPDLDSYYLMDATLLALPQTQDRLAKVIAYGQTVLQHPPISHEERQQLAIHATLLQESDLERIVSSLQTALNEDANFYGVSPTLQTRLPAALQEYRRLAESFITLTTDLANNEKSGVSAKDYVAAGSLAREASFSLWRITAE